MRHHNRNRKFGRKSNIRRALMRSLAESLIARGSIRTTAAKAKEVASLVETFITKGKRETLASRRRLTSLLGTDARAKKLVEVSAAYKNRAGGYTRITKLERRRSDGSPMAIVELVKS